MSDINNYSKIRFGGKEYEVAVTSNVIDEFQDKFNKGFFEISEMLEDEKQVYKVTRWLLWKMINDDIRRTNKRNRHNPLWNPIDQFEEWEIGDMLTFNGMTEILNSIYDAITESMPKPDENAPKQVTP